MPVNGWTDGIPFLSPWTCKRPWTKSTCSQRNEHNSDAIGIVDVAAFGKLAPLAGGPHPPPAAMFLSFDFGYARPVSCKLSTRSCSRALSS
jgi:hypothetical protein